MSRDVGRMGQEELRRWTSQVGIILNQSNDQDAAGWDFFLEWPHQAHVADGMLLPLDRRPGPIQCLIQVKATDGRRRSWKNVKLSNWLRLVRSPLPCFFLVLEFDGKIECQRASLVHVGKQQIHDALKRLRELSAKHGEARPNHHRLTLTWDKAQELDARNGEGLKRRIEAHVRPDMEQYATDKMGMVATVGYEVGGKRLNARVRPPEGWKGDPRELMMDFKLGLVSHLELQSGELIDTRFGIPAPEPDERLYNGRLESSGVASVGRASVRLTVPKLGREFRLDMTARVARDNAMPGEPIRGKIRLSVPFVDLVWYSERPEVDFKLKLPEPREAHGLSDLQRVAQVIALLDAAANAGDDVELDIR